MAQPGLRPYSGTEIWRIDHGAPTLDFYVMGFRAPVDVTEIGLHAPAHDGSKVDDVADVYEHHPSKYLQVSKKIIFFESYL